MPIDRPDSWPELPQKHKSATKPLTASYLAVWEPTTTDVVHHRFDGNTCHAGSHFSKNLKDTREIIHNSYNTNARLHLHFCLDNLLLHVNITDRYSRTGTVCYNNTLHCVEPAKRIIEILPKSLYLFFHCNPTFPFCFVVMWLFDIPRFYITLQPWFLEQASTYPLMQLADLFMSTVLVSINSSTVLEYLDNVCHWPVADSLRILLMNLWVTAGLPSPNFLGKCLSFTAGQDDGLPYSCALLLMFLSDAVLIAIVDNSPIGWCGAGPELESFILVLPVQHTVFLFDAIQCRPT